MAPLAVKRQEVALVLDDLMLSWKNWEVPVCSRLLFFFTHQEVYAGWSETLYSDLQTESLLQLTINEHKNQNARDVDLGTFKAH